MADPFPSFPEPTPLDDGSSWSAALESWDERTGNVYYVLLRHEADGTVTQLMARTHEIPAGSLPHLTAALTRVAESKESNTDYRGGLSAKRLRRWLLSQLGG